MSDSSSRSDIVKAIFVIEIVLGLIALAIPLTPDKGGRPFVWPSSLGDYFHSVLVAFAMGNGLVIVIAGIVWLYGLWKRRPT